MCFEKQINKIINDRYSGSVEVLQNTIDSVIKFLSENPPNFKADIIVQLNCLIKARPEFIVLFHFINNLFLEIERSKNPDILSIKKYIKTYQNNWKDNLKNLSETITNSLIFKNKNILLHSNSKTITGVFEFIANHDFNCNIFQTASAPANEGEIQAKKLAMAKYKINYISECAISNFIEKIDFAIFGADGIFENFFINKIGTFQIVLLFNYFNKPVYVFSDTRKFLNTTKVPKFLSEKMLSESIKPSDELLKNPNNNIFPINYYFEKTPNNLITKFFTESAEMSYNNLSDLSLTTQTSTLFE